MFNFPNGLLRLLSDIDPHLVWKTNSARRRNNENGQWIDACRVARGKFKDLSEKKELRGHVARPAQAASFPANRCAII